MRDFFKYALIVFFIAVLMGLLMSQILKKGSGDDILAQNIVGNTSEVGSSNGTAVQTSSSDDKILPNATLVLETEYEDCKHKVKEEEKVEKKLVNLSESELQEVYSDWSITEFTNSRVYLYKLSEGLCGNHFKISIDDNKIVVYKLTSDYETEVYKQTDITTEYLPEEDIEKLEEGIYVYGEAALNSALESYE